MIKVLINAYACSPGMGSEPGMAWNWCVNLARYCELFIVTEGEFRDKIEAIMPTLSQRSNMHFYYNPVSEKVRQMCWNQGDWRFYRYYKKWQKSTADIAREICKKEKIDILHQLNMIGFREPGYLWKVSQETEIPFVWGPIGGLKQFPMAYAEGSSIKMKAFLRLKNFLNKWQLKHDSRVDAAINQASLLISSIPDSYRAIKKYKNKESVIIPETGAFVQDNLSSDSERFKKDNLTILWVGKFDFRKKLDIALAALAKVSDINWTLKIFGTGNKTQVENFKNLSRSLGIDSRVQWLGNCPNAQIVKEMQNADIFLFTSINEDTSTVVLEAISNGLPVLCFNTCGMTQVVTDDIGIKIPLTNQEQSVSDFAKKIDYLYHHRELLAQMSESSKKRATQLSWENKAKQVVALYEKILQETVEITQ